MIEDITYETCYIDSLCEYVISQISKGEQTISLVGLQSLVLSYEKSKYAKIRQHFPKLLVLFDFGDWWMTTSHQGKCRD